MSKRVLMLAVAAATLAGQLGIAAGDTVNRSRQIEDACGDANSRATLGPRTQELEASDPSRDLAGAAFKLTYGAAGAEALVADIESCGAASSAVGHLLQIGFTDDCVLDVEYIPRRLGEGVTRAEVRVSEVCFEDGDLPTEDTREVSRVSLPATAATFVGKTARITVPLSAIPAVTAPRLAPGTVWDGSAVVLGDPEVGGFAAAGGTFSNPDAAVVVRTDTGQGSGYLVGQDAPSAS